MLSTYTLILVLGYTFFLSLLLCFLFFVFCFKEKNNLLNSLSCIIALINIIKLHRLCWKKRFTCMVLILTVIVCSKKKKKMKEFADISEEKAK